MEETGCEVICSAPITPAGYGISEGEGENIHYLLDLLNNPIQFQLHWIRTQNILLKLFNIAVTL